MADVSQVETSVSFEPRTPPVNPAGPNRSQDTGGNAAPRSSDAAQSGRSGDAVSVALSSEARRLLSAPDAAGGTQEPAGPDTTVETSAPGGIEGSDDAGEETNQVTSFQSERTGNDTHSTTEAARTLGQVVDAFA